MQHILQQKVPQLFGPGLELAPDVQRRHGGSRQQGFLPHLGGRRQRVHEHALAGVARRGQPEHAAIVRLDEPPERLAQIVRAQIAGLQQLGFQQFVQGDLAVVLAEFARRHYRRGRRRGRVACFNSQFLGAMDRQPQAVTGQVIEQLEAVVQAVAGQGVVQEYVLLAAHGAAAQGHQRSQAQDASIPFQQHGGLLIPMFAGAARVPAADRPPAGERGAVQRVAAQLDAVPHLPLFRQRCVDRGEVVAQFGQILGGVQPKRAMPQLVVAPGH